MAGQGKSILAVGLGRFTKPEFTGSVQASDAIRTSVLESLAKLNEAGFPSEGFHADPDDLTDTLSRLATAIRCRHWDGIAVGWGPRGFVQNTVLFEKIVNLVKDIAPHARLIFPESPELLFDAVLRSYSKTD